MGTLLTRRGAHPALLATVGVLALAWGLLSATGAARAQQEHDVQPGETLSHIAARYGTTVAELVRLNDLPNPNVIYAGATLVVSGQSGGGGSTPATGGHTHLVRAGETLSGIAAQYGQTVSDLLAMNDLSNPNLIFAGTTLRVGGTGGTGGGAPPSESRPQTHTVQPGENLTMIAARFQVSVSALIEVNQISNPNYIWAGQVLTLPGGATSAPAHATRSEAEDALRAAAAEFGMPASLVLALAWQESGWQQHVVSHAGAVGVMQVMPGTAVWAMDYLLGEDLDWRGNVYHNARVGVAVLAHWMRLSGGDPHMALGAYYQGWGAMQAYGPYAETVAYIENVLSLRDRYR